MIGSSPSSDLESSGEGQRSPTALSSCLLVCSVFDFTSTPEAADIIHPVIASEPQANALGRESDRRPTLLTLLCLHRQRYTSSVCTHRVIHALGFEGSLSLLPHLSFIIYPRSHLEDYTCPVVNHHRITTRSAAVAASLINRRPSRPSLNKVNRAGRLNSGAMQPD